MTVTRYWDLVQFEYYEEGLGDRVAVQSDPRRLGCLFGLGVCHDACDLSGGCLEYMIRVSVIDSESQQSTIMTILSNIGQCTLIPI
jgi:hypothetical protein